MAEDFNYTNNDESNNPDNRNKGKSILNIILIFCILINIVSFILPKTNQSLVVSTPTSTESTTVVETTPKAPDEMVGNMEFIGCSNRAVAANPVTFYYYRDIVTDEMFLVSYNTDNHTITPLIHPNTGFPLTYAEYQNMKSDVLK